MRTIPRKVQALGRYIDVQYVVRYFSVLCFTLAFLNITQYSMILLTGSPYQEGYKERRCQL